MESQKTEGLVRKMRQKGSQRNERCGKDSTHCQLDVKVKTGAVSQGMQWPPKWRVSSQQPARDHGSPFYNHRKLDSKLLYQPG